MKLNTLLLAIVSPIVVWAEPAGLPTCVMHHGFKTLKVQIADDFFAPPVLRLGDDRLTLAMSFDELGDQHRYLRYSIEHLTPAWQPSGLIPNEYASGFDEARVEDYAYSQNTFRHYVNYRILIPSPELRPLLSGNYIVRVWDEQEPDSTLLQARFSVSEDIGTITAEASHITDRGSAGTLQQLSFTYDTGEFEVRDPLSELQAIVVQNSDPYTATVARPLRVQGRHIVYEHRPELIFKAGNEYRRFESTRTDYTGMHIERNAYEGDGYSTWLITDYGRADGSYQYDRTQQGRFKIDEYSATDPDLGADYLLTHFTLDFPQVMNGEVYIDGEFTHHRLDQTTRMTYDAERHLYTLPMLLKQGSYNYRYLLRGTGEGDTPTASPVEGDYYETQNEYTIYIYYRPVAGRYWRLLRVATVKN